MHQDHKKISIVLTIYGDDGNLFEILSCINQQTQPPDEVVIVNCLHSKKIEKTIKLFKNLKIQYFYFNERLLPGGARNEGVRKSQYPYLAFLDSKTIPEDKWLENSAKELIDPGKFFVYGLTQYEANSEMQRIFLLSIYGKKPAITIPGMLIHRNLFTKIGGFNPNIRAGEDLEWKIRADGDDLISGIVPVNFNLRYRSISGNIFSQFYRSARNNWAAATVDAQLNTRALILGIAASLLLVISPYWNRFLGWAIFIPNITKIYFIFFCLSIVFIYLTKPQKIKVLTKNLLFPFVITITIFIIAFSKVFETGIQNIIGQGLFLDIDKIFISLLIAIGFIFRAFIAPIRLGANLNDLFPMRWIFMGILGLLNDLFKTPGYLLGACFTIGRICKRKIYNFL